MSAKPPLADHAAAPLTESERSAELPRRAHHLVPGGAHTYANGDDQ